jgi:uncharacterized membrane protein
MKIQPKKEIFYWLLCLIPFVYLAFIYKSLPESVPTHFGIDGAANDWSSKSSLWFMPAGMTVIIYLILTLIPKIDPKRRITKDSGKFEHVRFIVLLFITAVSCFAIYTSNKQSIAHFDKMLFVLVGLFFAALGNFMPTLKPNYFIGIRSPWALENEVVWKKTHQLAGKLWVPGGILLIALPFLLNDKELMTKIFIGISLAIALIPTAYSFIVWRQQKKEPSNS